jgi:hypothetical protein
MNVSCFYTGIALLLSGCSSGLRSTLPGSSISSIGRQISDVSGVGGGHTSLAVLAWVGGISTLGGIVLLALTRGHRGWYPFLGGIGLVLLNWLILTYAHALFLPVIIGTGVISVVWTYKITRQILSSKKGAQKCSQVSLLSWARRGSSSS